MTEPILDDVNIVVLAKLHNPSIATKDWLHRRNIITEVETNFVNTPAFSVFESETFSLFVDPNRLQVGLRKLNEECVESLGAVTRSYVAALPETPYHALGYNFRWRLAWDAEHASNTLRKLFVGDAPFLKRILGSRIETGGLMHVVNDAEDLTIRIAPRWQETDVEGAMAQFSYRYLITDVSEIKKRLRSLRATFQRSEAMAKDFQSYGGQL